MARVAPVNLPYNVKTLWFDPGDIDVHAADYVVVETARGTDIGMAASDIIEVSEEALEELKSPLRPVLRLATDEDLARSDEMEQKSREAMPIFKKLAKETNEDMHPVSVEYLLDGDKAIFYFEAEERVDFRDLVRKLANEFHVRIDMRQIGVRDEARIVGGIAHCGQVVCCKRLGGEFKPVSIRMAKDQDLSLNPQKISGLCGRLMCCLRYENEIYKEFNAKAPKVGALVKTPDGEGKVVEHNVPRETVSIKVEEEKPISIPLSGFVPAPAGERPKKVDPEAWDEAKAEASAAILDNTLSIFQMPAFSGEDKLGSAKAIHHARRAKGHGGQGDAAGKQEKGAATHVPGEDASSNASSRKRRRRHTSASGQSEQGKGTQGKGAKETKSRSQKPRGAADKQPSEKRQPRRRSTTIKADGSQKQTMNNASKANTGITQAKEARPQKKNPAKGGEQKLRPGHKSSGLAHAERTDSHKDAAPAKRRRPRRKPDSKPTDK